MGDEFFAKLLPEHNLMRKWVTEEPPSIAKQAKALERVKLDEDGDIVIHVKEGYDYGICADRIASIADAMFWICHIGAKGWPNSQEVLAGLIYRMMELDCANRGKSPWHWPPTVSFSEGMETEAQQCEKNAL